MYTFINKIKLLLYKYNIIKIKSTIDKIDMLIDLDISPYSDKYRNLQVYVIEPFIRAHTNELHRILNSGIEDKYYTFKPITERNVERKLFSTWCSNNGFYAQDDVKLFKEWLTEAKSAMILYEKISVNVLNNFGYSNSIKIKPYIINIDALVKDIADITLQ